jgi:hypothetical protein
MYLLNRPDNFILVYYLVIVKITDEMFIYGYLRQLMNSFCLYLAVVSMLGVPGRDCVRYTSYPLRQMSTFLN